MPVTQIGLVYFADDPDKRIFRRVYPTLDDAELDQPPTDGYDRPYKKEDGTFESWLTLGISPDTVCEMIKVDKDSPLATAQYLNPPGEPPPEDIT